MLEGHTQNVNGVAFPPDGKAVVSAAYDLTLRIWPLDGGAPTIVTLPAPLSAVVVVHDGEIIAAGANGVVLLPRSRRKADRRSSGRADSGHFARRVGRWQAGCSGRHPRLGDDHRPRGAQAGTHAGWARPAGVVGRVSPRQSNDTDRRGGPHGAPLGRDDRRSYRGGHDGDPGGPARGLCGRSRRGGVPRLRRLPHALARPGQPRRPDTRGHVRTQDRDACRATISPTR